MAAPSRSRRSSRRASSMCSTSEGSSTCPGSASSSSTRAASARDSKAAERCSYDLFVGIPSTGCPRRSRAPDSRSMGGCRSTTQPRDPFRTCTRWRVSGAAHGQGRRVRRGRGRGRGRRHRCTSARRRARQPYEGAGSCYIEFGGGRVGKVEANFLGGGSDRAASSGPLRNLPRDKETFASTRRARWFGS